MRIVLLSVQRNLDIMGLKILHHLLLEHGHESSLLYLPEYEDGSSRDRDSLQAFIAGQQPGLIGVSLMANDYICAQAVTRRLKVWFPQIPVVWGGIHPTTEPEMCAEEADYVCVGEAEHTLLEMAAALDAGQPLTGIANLCYKQGGQIQRNPLHPLIQDLDSLPPPRQIPDHSFVLTRRGVTPLAVKHLRRVKRYRGGVYKIMASRGCPYACTYCCNRYLRGLYGQWPVRRRSVGHLLTELEAALHEGPRVAYVDLADDCFLASSMDYLQEFCREYSRRIGRPFIAKTTPRYLTREKMDLLVDAGLGWINMGLQSGSGRVCEEVYKRPISTDEFLAAAHLVRQYPVAAYYDIIMDNPFETLDETLATVETLMATPRPFYPLLFSLTLYPGTELRDLARTEIPERHDEWLRKDYLKVDRRLVNDLVDLAPFLHRPWMRRLVARFRRDPGGRTTRWGLGLAKAYCQLILGPATYLRLIYRSQHGTWWGTLRALPVYLDRGLLYYLRRFAWFKRSGHAPAD